MVQGETNGKHSGTTRPSMMQPHGHASLHRVGSNASAAAAAVAARIYENMSGRQCVGGGGDESAAIAAAATSSNEKKKKVGNYIISRTIGEGSFAKVRLGYHLHTQQMVAVKVINKREVLKRNYLRSNLRREACMMQRMQHPHIIQLYEVMETENCYYIVMELIDGIEFVKYLSKK
jgi:serine/threonine protein kinase